MIIKRGELYEVHSETLGNTWRGSNLLRVVWYRDGDPDRVSIVSVDDAQQTAEVDGWWVRENLRKVTAHV